MRPPQLGRVRYADADDAPAVMAMVSESISKTFRVTTVTEVMDLIENCVLSICQTNVEGAVVGFLAAKDYPMIPSVHPSSWVEYIWTKYKLTEMSARNSLFIHLMCWGAPYGRDVVDAMLKSIFMHDPYLQFIGLVKTRIDCPLLVAGEPRAEGSFRRVQALERSVPGDLLPALCVAERKEVSPRLRVRRAVEEDNDDIVPIVERHSARLRELYGEYYISELVSRHPGAGRALLVCEHKELAVGVMCLNNQINYSTLEESYDLSPFAGLRHLDAHPRSQQHNKEQESASFVSDTCVSVNVNMDSSYQLETMSGALAKNAKTAPTVVTQVTWQTSSEESRDQCSSRPSDTLSYCGHLAVVDFLDQDEDEMEFDIVNIAPELFILPDLMTPDYFKNILDGRQQQKSVISDLIPQAEKTSNKQGMPLKSPQPTIRYSGPPNAFLLELFAMQSDYDERYGFDMLEVAFELFPDREYCVLCLPSKHPSYPLLEHFTLVTPLCTRTRFVNEALYVAHVNSVRGDIRVRPGEASDLVNLSDILERAPRMQELMDLFESSLSVSSLDSFVLLSQNQPVGVLVVGPLEDGTSIRNQYDLEPEPRRPEADCTVLAGVVSPAMEPHSRWFMRDVLRQSQYSTMFWMCQPAAKGEASPTRNMMSLAERMVPVRPRLFVPNISSDKSLGDIVNNATPFSLWVLERPLTSLPKVYVNSSIVVVGASRTGLAFLETLIMGPTARYLTFTNLTLVSDNGLPSTAETLKAAKTCLPHTGRYFDRYIKLLPFCYYVDVIAATMVKINRKKKCIYFKGGGVKFYDELVITCGQQYQHPDYMKEALELVEELKVGKPCERMLMDDPLYEPECVPTPQELPENVLLTNSLQQANANLRKLLHMVSQDKDGLNQNNPIVVYGECVAAYACMAALLELGVAARHIAFVEPFPPVDRDALRVNCFNNEEVDARVQASVASLGIRVVRASRLAEWRVRGARVAELRLMGAVRCVTQPCFALFYYGLRAIDLNAFRAINSCGLVYDGGLVVGPLFDTNDAHISGAGPAVRYSRRLHAASELHRYYLSEDVGEALAQIFLKKLNPFVMEHPDWKNRMSDLFPRFSHTLLSASQRGLCVDLTQSEASRRWEPVMKFTSRVVVKATLPGPLYYFKLRKPGPEVPMEVQLYLPRQGHTLLTDKDGNYFRLQLNELHCVDAVTCLSKEKYSSEVLSQLYGKHEAFFNKLLIRYQLNQIDDLYEFFMQPWMAALYQETFADLLDRINQQDTEKIYDLVKSMYSFPEGDGVDVGQTCSELPCHDVKDKKKFGTFRSVVNEYIGKSSSVLLPSQKPAVDIPSECGQSAAVRGEAAQLWARAGGPRIAAARLARHLARHQVALPNYAPPHPRAYRDDLFD